MSSATRRFDQAFFITLTYTQMASRLRLMVGPLPLPCLGSIPGAGTHMYPNFA